ncbi:MAG: histidinol-phosphate transaminase [Aestuariivita sp.]|nr:histidinol-phosphate transaminase [Aestuariivita sp.]MCY4346985.1 histidinol-phosphate transaminase [Aestuariivita sp.]
MTILAAKSQIQRIKPYKGGASVIAGQSNALKLSANENPFGPSPKAIAAIGLAATSTNRYPSSDHARLRERIGEFHHLDPEQIIIGAGSDEILTLLAMAYAGPGDEVVYPQHGFLLYPKIAQTVGARPIAAKESNRCVDIKELLSSVTPKTKIVYLANPANPTGTMLTKDQINQLASELPSDCVLVLDGAYVEFVAGFDGSAGVVDAYQNVVMTRTFSKIYGLGGLRVGWCYGAVEVISALNRIRGPFNVSSVALAAAEAALNDQNHAEKCRLNNEQQRERLCNSIRELGIECDRSYANFVLVRFASGNDAKAAFLFFQKHGIIVRPVTDYGFPEGLRITVGTPEDNKRVLETLKLFVGKI